MKTILAILLLCAVAVSAQEIQFYSETTKNPIFTGSYHFEKDSSLVIVVGEDTVYDSNKMGIYTTQPVYPIDYLDNYGKHHDIIAEHLLSLWQSYKKECYADSTKECFNLYRGMGSDTLYSHCSKYDFDLGANSNFIGQKEIWIHREPTFDGFMQYLDKQVKRK